MLVCLWAAETRTGYAYSMFLAERTVVFVAIYLINQHCFRICTEALTKTLDTIDQANAFIIWFPFLTLDECEAVNNAELQLLTKFIPLSGLPSYYGSDMRLPKFTMRFLQE